jgi:1A family penicillin-binding protein
MAIFLSFAILGVTWSANEFIFKDLPDPHDLTRYSPPVTTKILDRNGTVLFRLYEDENRTIVPLSKISPNIVQATVAIEDKDFYTHKGFSIRGISRALVSNYKGEQTQGGSTITQQLVKNRLLSSEQTLRRKIREAIVAILAEGIYEKDQILEMYLNQVAYGGSTYGIEEASHRYFGKSAADLDLAESALIAGLPAAPSAYTPFGSNPEFAKTRQIEVLRRMVEDGYITQQQAEVAASEQLQYATDTIDIEAPHFVMYVKELLEEEYGQEALYRGGLEIRTTLDMTLQDDIQKKVTDEITKLTALRVTNGAALVTNPKTGEVYAMVGSKDYFDYEHDGQVNVTTRPRQPGSSIKPLTYAIALEKGMTVTSLIQDQPITFNIAGSKPYSPKNYDGKYHGNVTLKESLASSYNIPAVKMLNQIGVNTLIDKAEEMGITTWKDRKRFGLSLTLGGGEVFMTDMAKAYGAFANEGYVMDLNPILEIHNYKGDIIYQNTCALEGVGCMKKKVLDSKVAYLITNILSDNAARTPAFGPLSTLFIPNQEVAVKTGTTNNMRDNWTFGYTSDRLVSVWVGNNDNQPMSYVASGVTGASAIWNDIMTTLLDEKNPHTFAVPPGLVKVAGCVSGSSKTCSGCGTDKGEYYIAGTEPKTICNVAQNTITSPITLQNNSKRKPVVQPIVKRP